MHTFFSAIAGIVAPEDGSLIFRQARFFGRLKEAFHALPAHLERFEPVHERNPPMPTVDEIACSHIGAQHLIRVDIGAISGQHRVLKYHRRITHAPDFIIERVVGRKWAQHNASA
ncbi:hypothetical protein D3C71_1558850 [compost metagenome]